VAAREAQLQDAFKTIELQQRESAVQDERQRMMREIHDGVGAQLVGLLNLVHKRETNPAVLEDHVRQALDEMRMAVDSLQPVHGDLVTMLATLRYRMQPRLAAAGLDVEWDVVNLPVLNELSPHAVLQVQRILLEAVTNALKHARASKLVVTVRVDESEATPVVRLCLSDNGVGLPADPAVSRGQGLANMRMRAQAIGASLQVATAAGGGTQVLLAWPVKPVTP